VAITSPVAQQTPKSIAETNATVIETIMPPEIKQGMGRYWNTFKYELAYILQEYKVGAEEIKTYLRDNENEISRQIRRINERYSDLNQERLRYIVEGIYVSAYIHGLPPALLLTICDSESNFTFPTNLEAGFGMMQINKAPLIDLLKPDRQSKIRLGKIGEQIKMLDGCELIGVVRSPTVYTRQGRDGIEDDEMKYFLCSKALYSAIWSARVILLRISEDGFVRGPELRNDNTLREIFRDYTPTSSSQDIEDRLEIYHIYSDRDEARNVVPKRR